MTTWQAAALRTAERRHAERLANDPAVKAAQAARQAYFDSLPPLDPDRRIPDRAR